MHELSVEGRIAPVNMTHSIRWLADRLLAPPSLLDPANIRARPQLVPAHPGIYGWWFSGALADVPMTDCLRHADYRLLYVGIAPARAPGPDQRRVRTLRDRLKNHARGPIATSTLRRSLAALLRKDLSLHIRRDARGKLRMSEEHEARLSAWMDAHARVGWVVCPAPWQVEEALLQAGPRLPLNIKGSSDPYRRTLSALRGTTDAPL
jgi:hypothetical protein